MSNAPRTTLAVQIASVPWEAVVSGHLKRQIPEKAAKSIEIKKNLGFNYRPMKNIFPFERKA